MHKNENARAAAATERYDLASDEWRLQKPRNFAQKAILGQFAVELAVYLETLEGKSTKPTYFEPFSKIKAFIELKSIKEIIWLPKKKSIVENL